jgi:AN1-type zinc finger protein 1
MFQLVLSKVRIFFWFRLVMPSDVINNIPNFGRHRYRAAHQCSADTKALKDKEDRKAAARMKIEEHLGKRPLEKKATPSTVVRPKRLNPKLELMKLKKRAKGDDGLPQESRLYFTVHFPESSKKESVPLFFDKVKKKKKDSTSA